MILFEPSKEKDPLMATDVEFAIAVAARALVRHKAANPYDDVVSALAQVKMGAWPKPFAAALIVGPRDAVSEIYDGVIGALDLQVALREGSSDAVLDQLVACELAKLLSERSGAKP